jgi:hypothetical protein
MWLLTFGRNLHHTSYNLKMRASFLQSLGNDLQGQRLFKIKGNILCTVHGIMMVVTISTFHQLFLGDKITGVDTGKVCSTRIRTYTRGEKGFMWISESLNDFHRCQTKIRTQNLTNVSQGHITGLEN